MSQRLAAGLEAEHEDIEAGQGSPYITSMEAYYSSKSAGFRGKIMLASWIPRSVRVHMINHVQFVLNRRAAGRRKVRVIAITTFARDPNAKRAQTKRFNYGKRQNGTVWKRDKKTGRFVRFSKREREVFKRNAK